MVSRAWILLASCLVLTWASSGCISMSVGIEPCNTPITEDDSYTVLGPTQGSAWGVMLYVLPLFESNPSQKAMDRAIRNCGGNALVEVTSTVTQYMFFIIDVVRTKVDGTAVKVTKGGAKAEAPRPPADTRPQVAYAWPPAKQR